MDFNLFESSDTPTQMEVDCGSEVSDLFNTPRSIPDSDSLLFSLDNQLLPDFGDDMELGLEPPPDIENSYYFLSHLEMPGRLDPVIPSDASSTEVGNIWLVPENKENIIPDVPRTRPLCPSENEIPTAKLENELDLATQRIDFEGTKTPQKLRPSIDEQTPKQKREQLPTRRKLDFSEKPAGCSDKSVRENSEVSKTTSTSFKKNPPKISVSKSKTAEKMFRAMTDTFQMNIEEAIRQEVQKGFDKMKVYFEEKFSKLNPAATLSPITGSEGMDLKPIINTNDEAESSSNIFEKAKKLTLASYALPNPPARDDPDYELCRVATVSTILKYAKSASLVDTLKKSIEKRDSSEEIHEVKSEPTATPTHDSESNGSISVYSENSKDCQVTDKSNSAENVFSSKHEQVEFAFGKGTKEEINDEREMEEDGKAKKSQDGPDLERKLRRERVPKPELPTRKKKKQPIVCDYCDRTFLNNSSLKQHRSFHFAQRPFQCTHQNCKKSYKTRSELNRHFIVHSGEKNYECPKCKKSFLRKQYLKTHLIRHNADLTWECALCSKVFVSEDDLDKHRSSYHKKGKRLGSEWDPIDVTP